MSTEINITDYKTFRQAVDGIESELAYHEGELNKKVENIAAKLSIARTVMSLFQGSAGIGSTWGKRILFIAASRIVGLIAKRFFNAKNDEAASPFKTGLKMFLARYKKNISHFFSNILFRAK